MVRAGVAVVALALWGACASDDALETRTVSLADFAVVDLLAPIAVTLEEGPAASAMATGPADALADLDFAVADGRLVVRADLSGGWLSPKRPPVTLALTVPPLRQVNIYEGATVRTAAPITSDAFEVVFRGKVGEADIAFEGRRFSYFNNGATAGLLRVRGRAERLEIRNVALASVEAGALEARVADVYNASRGDVVVSVADSLYYEIAGAGDIRLRGDPHLTNEGESGGGRLRHL